MEIKQLRNFIKIVEEGNITRAAQKLNMAQPPLSTQMHQLEKELNCVLFQRGSRNITLTDAGFKLYEKAKTILTLSDQIPEDIQGLGTEVSTLQLGIISSVSNFLPDIILPDFVVQYPNIRYNLYEKNTYQLVDALFSNIVDLAIVRTPFQNTGLTCYPIKKNSMYAIGEKQFFRDLDSEIIEFKELEQAPLVIYRRWEDIIKKHCKTCNMKPYFQCISDDARTALSWAERGYGVGIVPASILPQPLDTSLLAKEITNPSLNSDIMLIHRKGTMLSNAAKKFLDYIQKTAVF
jgi:Transcriptional regulator